MSCALYDILRGRFDDGTAVTGQDPHEMVQSVRDHLRRLLNARQGVLVHLPDYGLPDLPLLYSDLPYYRSDLLRAVRLTVERYEPRLDNVRVQFMPVTRRDCVIGIDVGGQLPDGHWAHFESAFQRDGHTAIYTRASREALHAGLL